MVTIKSFKNEFEYDIFHIEIENETFEISFQNNLDLYFRYIPKNNKKIHTFVITKENYFLYSLFNELYNNIKNNNPYNEKNSYNTYYYNDAHKLLFKDNKVIWMSDDFLLESASYIKLEKNKDNYLLTFRKSKEKNSLYMPTFTVRISNSGSRYNPFNILFMNLYFKLIDYNPKYHQIHLEEIEYQKKTLKIFLIPQFQTYSLQSSVAIQVVDLQAHHEILATFLNFLISKYCNLI